MRSGNYYAKREAQAAKARVVFDRFYARKAAEAALRGVHCPVCGEALHHAGETCNICADRQRADARCRARDALNLPIADVPNIPE